MGAALRMKILLHPTTRVEKALCPALGGACCNGCMDTRRACASCGQTRRCGRGLTADVGDCERASIPQGLRRWFSEGREWAIRQSLWIQTDGVRIVGVERFDQLLGGEEPTIMGHFFDA